MEIQSKIIFRVIFIVGGIIFYFSGTAQTKEVPYTLDDRDRMIRLENEIHSLRNEMNGKYESLRNEMQSMRNELNTKLESQRNEMQALRNEFNAKFEVIYWAFGFLISLILALFGYIVFDRKKDIEPLKEKTHSISENQNNIIKALKDFANENPKLLEFLKSHGLL
jgi:predicted PurR-regulated permease PerM